MPPDSASSGDRVWTRRWRARVIDDACRELDRRAEMLERRRECGFVRECHGDLHLRNIVLLEGRPTLFDGVEFNDEISCTDVSTISRFS